MRLSSSGKKKADSWRPFCRTLFRGWKAEDAKSQSMGSAMFGGGVAAERSYVKGDSRVNVTIITDSPMMQAMMMMFSNPMMATSDGGKQEKIQWRKGNRQIQQREQGRKHQHGDCQPFSD
ncbi:MAG: hypothetical protein U5R30_16000 [Deltaproteobacteria bacterium]|nr:hypothetical protein [Deltaproteobacteria bacterium]